MNDFWLFLGIIVFLFVLWVYSGGPNNPISFSGPYITPVTAPGVTQVGYGSANASLNVGNGAHVSGDVISAARSASSGKVHIAYSKPQPSDPNSEYLLLHLGAKADVDVTGWRLIDTVRGNSVQIPQGSFGNYGANQDIELSTTNPDAYIVSGVRDNSPAHNINMSAWYAFLGSPHDLWQDDTDTITLLDQNGKVVDQYRY